MNNNEKIKRGRPRIDDIKRACNIIKQYRKNARKRIGKTIRVPLEDKSLNNILCLKYNPDTKNISFACSGIGYKKIAVYPKTNKKLKCTNKEALDMLEKQRKLVNTCNKKRKKTV